MADSLQSIDKRCTFRETFESEHSVLRNGATLAGAAAGVSIKNGTGTFLYANNAYGILNVNINSLSSIRIKFKILNNANLAQNRCLLDMRDKSNLSAFVYVNGTTNALRYDYGTGYINGVTYASTAFVIQYGVEYDLVLSGCVSRSLKAWLNRVVVSMSNGSDIEVSLFEVYSGTLVADEVKNLYENKRYREISSHNEQLGAELVNQSAWYTAAYWDAGTAVNWTQAGTALSSNGTNGTNKRNGIFTIGKKYKITYSSITTSGNCYISDGATLYKNIGTTTTETVYGYAAGTQLWLQSLSFNGTITALSIKEVLVSYVKPILDVCACNGVINNKYSGDTYVETLSYGDFENGADIYSADTGVTVARVTGQSIFGNYCLSAKNSNALYGFYRAVKAAGTVYRLRFYHKNPNTTFQVRTSTTILKTIPATSNWVFEDFTFTSLAANISFWITSVGEYVYIDDISIKEVILPVVNTSVEVVSENDLSVMKFNGSTSKIDCGSYDSLIGDKTFVFWAQYRGWSSAGEGRIIDNGKFLIRPLPNYYRTLSDGTTAANSNQIISLYKWQLTTITRSAAGLVNFYANGAIVGSTNLSSGTPTVGTTNLIIGNRDANDRGFKGLMSSVRIYDGILTPAEIAQIYSNEKSKYGL